MAKIKIREGSLEVWLDGHGAAPIKDENHVKGRAFWIEFEPWGTRYRFKEGMLVRAEADGGEAEEAGQLP